MSCAAMAVNFFFFDIISKSKMCPSEVLQRLDVITLAFSTYNYFKNKEVFFLMEKSQPKCHSKP